MTRKELKILKDIYDEYLGYKNFYLNLAKESPINSDEHEKALDSCSQIWEKIELIKDIASRMGITL